MKEPRENLEAAGSTVGCAVVCPDVQLLTPGTVRSMRRLWLEKSRGVSAFVRRLQRRDESSPEASGMHFLRSVVLTIAHASAGRRLG